MTYKLKFHPDALDEWNSLSATDKNYFRKKLEQRLENPHIPGSRLSGGFNLYKIKRKRPPLRLTYHANDQDLVVTALSVGKRDGDVYTEMIKRYGEKNSKQSHAAELRRATLASAADAKRYASVPNLTTYYSCNMHRLCIHSLSGF